MLSTEQNTPIVDDGINLFELIERLIEGWRWWIGGSVIGLAGALGFLGIAPSQYEAKVVIQPAVIGATNSTFESVAQAVEPVVQTLERLKISTFYTDEVLNTCKQKFAKEIALAVNASLIKGNNLIKITYRAASTELAASCMSKIVEQLAMSQSVIAADLIKELKEEQASLKKQVEAMEYLLVQSEKSLTKTIHSAGDVPTFLLLKREELMKLQETYRQHRIKLTEPLTQALKPLEPVEVSDQPVSPKALLTIALGTIAGLFLGVIALFISINWKRYRLGTHMHPKQSSIR